jgi:hypothetical protein
MIAFAPDRIRDNLLMECYYPLAMALGCVGLLVLGRGTGWPHWWRIALINVLFSFSLPALVVTLVQLSLTSKPDGCAVRMAPQSGWVLSKSRWTRSSFPAMAASSGSG